MYPGWKNQWWEGNLITDDFLSASAWRKQQLQHIGYMEIIKSFWEGMTNVCACVYGRHVLWKWSEVPTEGIASILPPGQEEKKLQKILKIKFSVKSEAWALKFLGSHPFFASSLRGTTLGKRQHSGVEPFWQGVAGTPGSHSSVSVTRVWPQGILPSLSGSVSWM